MRAGAFLSDRRRQLLLHGAAALALSLLLVLTGTAGGIVMIILCVWVAGLAVCLLVNYYREKNYLDTLMEVMEGLDQKHLFAECAPKPKRIYEKQLFALMRRSGKAMIETASQVRRQQQEYQEYIENWVHEVKVPITAIQLICRNNKSEFSGKIMPQLGQIEEHVERALYYARLDSVEKDFIIHECSLNDIVGPAISKQQALLIQSGIRVETENLETVVYTDGKWASFIIGQLFANAVRYKGENPVIQVKAKVLGNRVQLCITDNGIGIAVHELPRIFDRGFTGSNGRSRGGSTGMGLYLGKTLAEFLQIEMKADSEVNNYTRISLTFPGKESLTKM